MKLREKLMNWYRLYKNAQIWKVKHSEEYGDLENHLRRLYELQYKYDTTKSSGFSGHPKRRQNILLGLEGAMVESISFVKEKLLMLFGRWLESHALTDANRWAESRMGDEDELQMNIEHGEMGMLIENIIGEFVRYSPDYKYDYERMSKGWNGRNDIRQLINKATYEIISNMIEIKLSRNLNQYMEYFRRDMVEMVENEMYNVDEEEDPEEWQELMRQKESYEEMDQSDFVEYIDIDHLSHSLDSDDLKLIYEHYVFPHWYDEWAEQGIDATRENVENVYRKIEAIDGRNVSNDLVTINIALNTVHQTGSMLDYVEKYAGEDLSYDFLEQMSNLDAEVEEWDDELRKVGVQVGDKYVQLV